MRTFEIHVAHNCESVSSMHGRIIGQQWYGHALKDTDSQVAYHVTTTSQDRGTAKKSPRAAVSSPGDACGETKDRGGRLGYCQRATSTLCEDGCPAILQIFVLQWFGFSDVSKIKLALSRFVQQLSVYSSLNGEWRSCQEFPSRMILWIVKVRDPFRDLRGLTVQRFHAQLLAVDASWPGATEGEAHGARPTGAGKTQGPSSQSLARPGGTLRVARAIEAQGPAVVCFFLLGGCCFKCNSGSWRRPTLVTFALWNFWADCSFWVLDVLLAPPHYRCIKLPPCAGRWEDRRRPRSTQPPGAELCHQASAIWGLVKCELPWRFLGKPSGTTPIWLCFLLHRSAEPSLPGLFDPTFQESSSEGMGAIFGEWQGPVIFQNS